MSLLESILVLIALAIASCTAQSLTVTPTDLSQLSSIISAQYSRYSYCETLISTCAPSISSCASSVCASCTNLGESYINNCCIQGPAPTACFSSVKAAGGGDQYPSTAPPPLPSDTVPYGPITNTGAEACTAVSKYSSYCRSVSPGWGSLTIFDEQAFCLCYGGRYPSYTWLPNSYDHFVAACDAYIGASTIFASVNTAPCQAAGDVRAQFSSYTATHGHITPTITSTTGTSTTATTTPATTNSSGEGSGFATGVLTAPLTSLMTILLSSMLWWM